MRGLDPRIHQKDVLSLSGWIAGSSQVKPGNDALSN
jgi:hypothetical protein